MVQKKESKNQPRCLWELVNDKMTFQVTGREMGCLLKWFGEKGQSFFGGIRFLIYTIQKN